MGTKLDQIPTCDICGGKLHPFGDKWICKGCGKEKEIDLDKWISKERNKELISSEENFINDVIKGNDLDPRHLQNLYDKYDWNKEIQVAYVGSFLKKLIDKYKPNKTNLYISKTIRRWIEDSCVHYKIDSESFLQLLNSKLHKYNKNTKKKVGLIISAIVVVALLIVGTIFTFTREYLAIGGTIIKYQKNAEMIDVPNNYMGQEIVEIGNGAFKNKEVKTVKIPEGVIELGEGAFENCSSLESVELPNSLKVIHSEVFSGCNNLTEIVLPQSVDTIGSKAFNGIDNLNLVFQSTKVPNIYYDTFEGVDNLTIHVPNDYIADYKKAFYNNVDDINVPLVNVKFYVDGKEYEIIDVEYGSDLFKFPEEPTRVGYVGKWEVDELLNVKEEQIINLNWEPLDNIKFTVVHQLEKLDGTFEDKYTEELSGTADTYVVVNANSYDGFTVENRESNKAYINADGSTVYEIKYYRNKYTINFDSIQGSEIDEIKLTYGQKIEDLPESSKQGYTFSGWYTNVDYTTILPYVTMPAHDFKLFAKWTPRNDTKYQVIHQIEQLDGSYMEVKTEELIGTTDSDVTYQIMSFDQYEVPTKSGDLKIKGDGTSKIYLSYNLYTRSVVYYIDNVVFKIDYYKVGAAVTPLIYEGKDGYTFSGWSGTLPETMPNSDIHIFGTLSINSYSLNIRCVYEDGTPVYSIPTQEIKFNHSYKVVMEEYIGYTPNYKEISGIMGSKDVNYEVVYIANPTQIKFDVKQNSIQSTVNMSSKTQTIKYNTSSAIIVPSADYYVFKGWYNDNGVKLTDENGNLLPNVAGYTSNGKWTCLKSEITLHVEAWEQKYADYTYIYEASQISSNIRNNPSGKYMIIKDIGSLGKIEPIPEFKGVLDGRGHTLSGWSYVQTSTGSIGLFKVNSGTIKNLKITNFTITNNDPNVSGTLYAGALCGENRGTIEKVHITASSISVDVGSMSHNSDSYVYVGMLCGINIGNINRSGVYDGCYIYAYAGTKYEGARVYSGCIAGKSEGGALIDVFSHGNKIETVVKANWKENIFGGEHGRPYGYTGGIVGYGYKTMLDRVISHDNNLSTKVERDCHHSITNDGGKQQGSIMALRESSTLTNCYSESGDTLFGDCDSSNGATKVTNNSIKLSDLTDTVRTSFVNRGWKDVNGNPIVVLEVLN